MARSSLEERFHQRFVRNYDRMIAPIERRIFAEPRARLVARAAGRVLDLGAGTGVNFALYGEPARLVAAVDPETGMLAQSHTRVSSSRAPVALVAAEGEALPFADNSFDAAVVTLVLCTVHDPQAVLSELRRVLVPGGAVLALEHVRSSWGVLGLAQDALTPINRIVAGGCNLNRRTVASLESAGFRVDSIRKRFAGSVVEVQASA